MPWLYERLFEHKIRRALSEHKVEGQQLDPLIQRNFAKALKQAVETRFPTLIQEHKTRRDRNSQLQVFLDTRQVYASRQAPDVLSIHAYNLHQLAENFKDRSMRTTRTCLSCLLRTPEKMLDCGHALCDICVRRLGRRVPGCKLSTILSKCPLCGIPHSNIPFRHTPPTAGIRVLCLDGGGIKGIIPLIFLQHLQKKLHFLEVPLSEYFDFVCGTSAGKSCSRLCYRIMLTAVGGLIEIGIFLMGRSVDRCITTFEGLAVDTFGPKAVHCRF